MERSGTYNSFSGENHGIVFQANTVELRSSRDPWKQARENLEDASERLFVQPPSLQAGALDELEDIGLRHTELRRRVVDVLCWFLRENPHEGDRRVCAGAQEILSRRLSRHDFHQGRGAPDEPLWTETKVNLSGALLHDFSFMDSEVDDVDFTGTVFRGFTRMSGMRVRHDARFDGASFQGPAFLEGTRFEGSTSFTGASFDEQAFLHRSTFSYGADFDEVEFSGRATFRSSRFDGDARFSRARFHKDAVFEEATFSLSAIFVDVGFSADVSFDGSVFDDEALFTGVGRTEGLHFGSALLHPHLLHRVPPGWRVQEYEGRGYVLPEDE